MLGQVVRRQFSGIYLERLKLLKLRQRCAQGASEGIDRYELGPSLAKPHLREVVYRLRYWPQEAGRFDPSAFRKSFRHALRVLADSGRALEINTEGAAPARDHSPPRIPRRR